MNSTLMEPHEKCLRLIRERSKAMNGKKYLDDILNFITMVAINVTHMKICTLWLLDEHEMSTKMCFSASRTIDPESLENKVLGLNEGVVGLVAARKRPLIVDDVLTHPMFKEKETAKKLNMVSMLSVPMMNTDSNVLGVLNCYTTHLHKFGKKEVDRMCAVANQGAVVAFKMELILRDRLIQAELENLKTIKRASKLLCRKRQIDANEAMGWIKKCSINSFSSIRHVAEAILLSNV